MGRRIRGIEWGNGIWAGVDRGAAVGGAVRVLEGPTRADTAANHECSAMDGAVMRGAESGEIRGLVGTAFRAGDDVMHVEPAGAFAAASVGGSEGAAVVVAGEDELFHF